MYSQFYLSMPTRQCRSEKDKQNPSNFTCSFPQSCELSAPNLCNHAFGLSGQIHTAIKYRGGVRKADNFEEASAIILDIDLDPYLKTSWSQKVTPQKWKAVVLRYASAVNASQSIRFYAVPSLSYGIHLYFPLQRPIAKPLEYKDAASVLIELLKSGDSEGWHVDSAVKDAGRMILNGAVVDKPGEWIFESEGESWSYDKRKNYAKRSLELISNRRDMGGKDLLTPGSRNNNLLSLALRFANQSNDFSYVLGKLNEEIARQIAQNTDPARLPVDDEEVEGVVRKACAYASAAPLSCSPAFSGGSSLNVAGIQVRKALRDSYKIAPQDSANPDERRFIYKLFPSSDGDDGGYAEPISEEDYSAAVSDVFWQIQTSYEDAVWQKLNHNRNMFQAKVILSSSGLRFRNPHEAFFCNGVFDGNTGNFDNLKPGEYLVSPLGFPYTEEPCNGPFKTMLETVFDHDKKRIALFKNAVRSSITYDSGEAMAVFLYGEGITGKSKLMEVFEQALVNKLGVLKTAFLTGEDKFALSSTQGSYMVVCNEMDGAFELSNTAFKRLASNDLNSFEAKGKPVHFDHIKWKPFILLNTLPPFREDNDDAAFRRVCIIEFKHKFDRNIPFEVTSDLVEDCRRWICEAVRSKRLEAEEWNNLPIVLKWKTENSVDYVLTQVLVHEKGKSVTLASLRKRLKDGGSLPKKVMTSPRAFRQWVSGSSEFTLGLSHKQDALKDTNWNPDSDLNRMTDASSFTSYPVKTDEPEVPEDFDDYDGGF